MVVAVMVITPLRCQNN